MRQSKAPDRFVYDAFISYKHGADKPVAAGLQTIMQALGNPWWRRRSMRVFRDDTTLTPTHELWRSIEKALAGSRNLVIIASPEAAASPWVGREVEFWLRNRPLADMYIAVSAGELVWDAAANDFVWNEATPLPISLRGKFSSEPLWIDLRAYRGARAQIGKRDHDFVSRAAGIAAAILRRAKEDLLSDELRQQRRNLALAWGAAGTIAVAAATAVWWAVMAINAQRLAEEKERIAVEERNGALVSQSRYLSDMSRQAIEVGGDATLAALLALEALPDKASGVEITRTRPLWAPAEVRLDTARRALRERRVLSVTYGPINGIALTPDGTHFVAGSADWSARLWQLDTGKEVAGFFDHENAIDVVAVAPDRSFVVSGSLDETVRVWDIKTKAHTVLRGHRGRITAVAVSPDSSRVFTAAADKTVRVWDARTGALLRDLGTYPSTATSLAALEVVALARHAVGLHVAVGLEDGTVQVVSPLTGQVKFGLHGHRGAITGMASAPDGAHLVTGSADGTARIWDVSGETSRPRRVLEGDGSPITSIAVSGKAVYGLMQSGRLVKGWALSDGEPVAQLPVTHALSLAVTPDDRLLLTGGSSGALTLWSPAGDPVTLPGTLHRSPTTPDGKLMALADKWSNWAEVVETSTGERVCLLEGHEQRITTIAMAPDGAKVITGSEDDTARVWDTRTGKTLAVLKGHGGTVTALAVTPDSRIAVTGSDDHTVRTWDIETGNPLKVLNGHSGAVRNLAITPDGSKLVSVSYDRSARVWDLASGASLVRYQGHRSSIAAVAVAPDGKRVITGSSDRTMRVWSIETGEDTSVTTGFDQEIMSVAVTADGIVTDTQGAGFAGLVRVWPAALDTLNAVADERPLRVWPLPDHGQSLVAAAQAEVARCLTPAERKQYHLSLPPPRWCVDRAKWPYDQQGALLVGRRLLRNSEDEEARALLDASFKHRPEMARQVATLWANAFRFRGTMTISSGNYGQVDELFAQAIAHEAGSAQEIAQALLTYSKAKSEAGRIRTWGRLLERLATSSSTEGLDTATRIVGALHAELAPRESRGNATRCDELASHPDDPLRTAAAVAFDMIDAPRAIADCTRLIEQKPDGRSHYLRARAHLKAARAAPAESAQKSHDAAIADLTAAMEQHYPMAFLAMASAHVEGWGMKKDPDRARALQIEAFNRFLQCCWAPVGPAVGAPFKSGEPESATVFLDQITKWAAALGNEGSRVTLGPSGGRKDGDTALPQVTVAGPPPWLSTPR